MEDDKLFSGKMGRTSLPEISLILVTWGVIFFQVGPSSYPGWTNETGQTTGNDWGFLIESAATNVVTDMGQHMPRDTAVTP